VRGKQTPTEIEKNPPTIRVESFFDSVKMNEEKVWQLPAAMISIPGVYVYGQKYWGSFQDVYIMQQQKIFISLAFLYSLLLHKANIMDVLLPLQSKWWGHLKLRCKRPSLTCLVMKLSKMWAFKTAGISHQIKFDEFFNVFTWLTWWSFFQVDWK